MVWVNCRGGNSDHIVWVSFSLQIYNTFEFWRFKLSMVWVLVWVSSFYGDEGWFPHRQLPGLWEHAPSIGACAMTTKFLDNKILKFEIVLSWRFPSKKKTAFRTISLSAAKARPLKKRKIHFYCRLAVWIYVTYYFNLFLFLSRYSSKESIFWFFFLLVAVELFFPDLVCFLLA